MISVECNVQVHQSQNPPSTNKMPSVTVRNHWNHNDRVVIRIDDGTEVTVIGRDLIAAIENAMRTNRF